MLVRVAALAAMGVAIGLGACGGESDETNASPSGVGATAAPERETLAGCLRSSAFDGFYDLTNETGPPGRIANYYLTLDKTKVFVELYQDEGAAQSGLDFNERTNKTIGGESMLVPPTVVLTTRHGTAAPQAERLVRVCVAAA
jgi:hypothetical protein